MRAFALWFLCLMTTNTDPVAVQPAAARIPRLPRGGLELPWTRWLFRSRQASALWLLVRLWLGWQWFSAGWDKLTGAGYNNWFTHAAGLQGFIAAANASYDNRAKAYGHPEVNYAWYLHILNSMDVHAQVFSQVVTISELAVGIGLLLGCLTGRGRRGRAEHPVHHRRLGRAEWAVHPGRGAARPRLARRRLPRRRLLPAAAAAPARQARCPGTSPAAAGRPAR
jgi:uncharacterized membrane protein YphA (DoxX/SURF4 family)